MNDTPEHPPETPDPALSSEGSADADSPSSDAGGWRPTPHWYAAEIIVVVVGVIIALAANAWWEGWREEALEAEVIRAVRQELMQNREDLRTALEATEDCLSRTDHLLRRSASSLRKTPADSGVHWVRGLSCRRTFDPTLSAAQALSGAPGLDSVDDLKVRTAVANWVTALTDAEEERLELSTWGDAVYEALTPYAERFAVEGLPDFPSIPRMVARGAPGVLAELRGDPGVMGAVIHKAHYQQAYRQELTEALMAADSALVLLDRTSRD